MEIEKTESIPTASKKATEREVQQMIIDDINEQHRERIKRYAQ